VCNFSGPTASSAENLVQGANFHRIAEREREEERDDFSKHAMLGVRMSIFFSTFHFNLFSFRIKPFSLAECALFFPLHHFQQVFNSTPPDCR